MASEILMPALSPTMETGTLAKWHVKEGDAVASGDILAEIETDKAVMEFEAVDDGVIGSILVAEGSEGVPVNSPIATLIAEGEDPAAAATTAPPARSVRGAAAATRIAAKRIAKRPCPHRGRTSRRDRNDKHHRSGSS